MKHGKAGETVPEMKDEWVKTISARYIELYEKVTGKSFVPSELSDAETREKICAALTTLEN